MHEASNNLLAESLHNGEDAILHPLDLSTVALMVSVVAILHLGFHRKSVGKVIMPFAKSEIEATYMYII